MFVILKKKKKINIFKKKYYKGSNSKILFSPFIQKNLSLIFVT